MSLSKTLKSLKKQRREEVQKLHYIYLHTKRDAKRTLSPDRYVRKHLGASLGVAAVLGFLLAPKPPAKPKPVKPRKDTVGGHLSQLVRNLLMQVERFIPMPKDHAPHARPGMMPPLSQMGGPKGLMKLLMPLLMGVLTRLDLTKMMADLMGSLKSKVGSNGHKPHVSVADAGTVQPENFQDFE